jgi:membrane-associated phospholipid phosphatase
MALPAALLLSLLLAVGAMPLCAQSRSEADIIWRDWGDVYSAPAHFDTGDWLWAGAAVAATFGAWSMDEDVRSASQRLRSPTLDDALVVGDVFGSGEFALGLTALVYGGGALLDDAEARTTGRLLLQSLLYAEFINGLMKMSFGRSRPYTGAGRASFDPFSLDHARTSFPSGHSTAASAIAMTLSKRLDSPVASVLLFGMAGVTMVQRIVSDNHWLSDTVLGAVLGGVVAHAVVELEKERERRNSEVLPLGAGAAPHRPLLRLSVPY